METPTHDKLNYLAYQLQCMAKKACCKYIFWKGPHKVLLGVGLYSFLHAILSNKCKQKTKTKTDDFISLYFGFFFSVLFKQ